MVGISVKEDEASINPDNVTDSDTINPGETVEITVSARQLTETVDVYLGGTAVEASDDLNERVGGNEIKLGTADPNGPPFQVFHYTPQQPGTLNAYTSNTWASAVNARVESGDGSGGIQNDTAYAPGEESDAVAGDDTLAPSNYAGIVNADNEQGIALAPRLRREGAELGPDGATVNLPDGRTVEVGAIQEADEVARYVEGDQAGGVVDADQPAADQPEESNTNGSGAGVGAAVVVALLALGYGATRS